METDNINNNVVNNMNNQINQDINNQMNNQINQNINNNENNNNLKKKIIEFSHICKYYDYDGGVIKALDDINMTINEGELVIILGDSGAGKSTALNILGGMDCATSGTVVVDGKTISEMKEEELTKYRRNDIGFVFQFYNLVQNLTILENVELATQITQNPFIPQEILEKVGLKDRLNNFPGQISGGEQQRASIARAICKNPRILLCDEPTGALDYKTGKMILSLLQEINKTYHITVIIVTHNSLIKGIGDRIIHFKSGKIDEIIENKDIKRVEELEW